MSETFTFTGDHNAVEDWASSLVKEHVGHPPSMAVFGGDYQGIYIDPKRCDSLGLVSRYAEPVLIQIGEVVEWTGTEFVRARSESEAVNAWWAPTQGHIFRPDPTWPGEQPPMVRVADQYVVHELPTDAVPLVAVPMSHVVVERAELERLREVAERARVYLAEDHVAVHPGRAVTFAEGLARATLVSRLDDLAVSGE